MADVRSAIITDNEFYGRARIVNRARGRVVIADNIEQTDEDPFPQQRDSGSPPPPPPEG